LAAKVAGYRGLLLGIAFMSCSCLLLLFFSPFFLTIFTKDTTVVSYASQLILFVAIFQIFDGIQVVSGGALRGRGETAISMWANLIGHWGIGFPLGLWLAFKKDLGGRGLWAGLCVGLISVAIILFYRWWDVNRSINANSNK
jgi:MATE family multidrug resistance protein